MTRTRLDDDQLLAKFTTASLTGAEFGHADHVRLAWLHLRRWPLADAARRVTAGLQRLAAAHGGPERYHATITWAFLLLVHERQQASPAGTWEAFAAAHPDLLTWQPSVLDRYYRPATLQSPRARQGFVMPDRLCGGADRLCR
jgi:hypothetical protein